MPLFELSPYWILSFRCEILTNWFKIFPFFVSDYFFIMVIAVAYWLNPRNRLFLDLGWLISLSTLLNGILKKIFSIPRPPSSLHLLPINDGSFGFPSGDVQVGSIFFVMIFLSFQSRSLKIISIFMIANIMLSRLYLGVHSIYDVSAGLIFGVLTVLIYKTSFIQSQISQWENSAKIYYLLLIFVLIMCFYLWHDTIFPSLILLSTGTLAGYGLAYIYFKYNKDIPLNDSRKYIGIFINLVILFTFYKTFPVLKTSALLFNITILLKYALLPIWIYTLLPYLQKKLFK